LLQSVNFRIKLVLQVSLSHLKLLNHSGVGTSAYDGFNTSASVLEVLSENLLLANFLFE